jgi:hypothetical protein
MYLYLKFTELKNAIAFYVDVLFPLSLSLTKLLPDFTVYMNNTMGVL